MLGEEIEIFGNWAKIHFTENYGMAFGVEFGGEWGKVVLSLFRILAVGGIAWYIHFLIKKNAPKWLIISLSMIFAGALGNIIDSAFYGILFSESNYQIATFLPEAGGYAGFLHGKVVDMFYFPMLIGHFPSWSPIWADELFIFFRPVFNFADASITVGVSIILLFYRSYFKEIPVKTDKNTEAISSE